MYVKVKGSSYDIVTCALVELLQDKDVCTLVALHFTVCTKKWFTNLF